MKLEPSESKDYTITAKQNNQDSPQTGVTPPIIPAVLLGASLIFVTFTLIKNKKANKMFTEKPEFSEQDQKKWSMLYMRLSRKEYSELDDVSKRVFAWHEAYVKLLWEKRKILDSQC